MDKITSHISITIVYLIYFFSLYTDKRKVAYRILIVDDDIELLKMLKNYFEIKRYDVMMAEDGADTLEKSIRNRILSCWISICLK